MDLDIKSLKMPGASVVNYDDHISKNEPAHTEQYREPIKRPEPSRPTEQPRAPEAPRAPEPKVVKNIMDDDIFSSVVNVPPQQQTQPPPTQPKQEEDIFGMGLGGISFQTNPPPQQKAPVNNDPFNILGL